jgi:hypothetical protein
MRLYLVRRTRGFIQDNYAETDPANGHKFLIFDDGSRSYFPIRMPRIVKFKIDDPNPEDQYAQLYALDVVNTVNGLNLSRYGTGNYVASSPHELPTQTESKLLQDLSRAGKRLMGFCRTNRQLRSSISDQALAELVVAMRDEDRLCLIHEEEQTQEPKIICSMGLVDQGKG